jgi:four helix bundle protein
MRDHRKLRAFELADALTLEIYKATVKFPREEQFGLTSQMRRAAVSIVCNIVEGCARKSQADYLRFLDMAFGSTRELEYQLSLVYRLGYLKENDYKKLHITCDETAKVLSGLIKALRQT